ncbi:hypothetical protein PO909_033553 [Leuciscus waleckii]
MCFKKSSRKAFPIASIRRNARSLFREPSQAPVGAANGAQILIQSLNDLKNLYHIFGQLVPEDLCEDESPPKEVSCVMACSGDCVLSSWSDWSSCSHSCSSKNSEGRQSRTRTVLGLPGEAKACPAATALEEWRTCNDHPCITFYWEASPWGPCIEDSSMNLNGTGYWNGTTTCAVGVQIRKVVCMKMGVGPVIPKSSLLHKSEVILTNGDIYQNATAAGPSSAPLEPPGLTTVLGRSRSSKQRSYRGEDHQQRRQSGLCRGKDTGSSAEDLIVEEYTYRVTTGTATYGHPA